MSLKRALFKYWRYGLVSLLLLLVLSRWHYGTLNVHLDDEYDKQHPVKVLSRQLWLHPFTNKMLIQWNDRPKCTMTLIYRRDTHIIWVDCLGGIPDPYVFTDVSDLEIHRLGQSNGAVVDLMRSHPYRFVYDPKTSRENPELKWVVP